LDFISRINCDAGVLIEGADTDVENRVVDLPRIDTFWREMFCLAYLRTRSRRGDSTVNTEETSIFA
jgi:hypothetical protein